MYCKVASETRTIEKFGVLKLLPADRGANNLLVTSKVIQLPFSEYFNTKSNPNKGHYGYCCLMYGEFVIQLIDIQFRNQIIIDRDQYVVQLAYQEFHNSKEIIQQLADVVFDTVVSYPIWNCTELRFKLEPGVIIEVFKSSIPMVLSQEGGIDQDNLIPPPPPAEPPADPPAEDAPPEDKIPLSPPYQGEDDNGNTYVRDEPEPEEPGSPGPDCTKGYRITWTVTTSNNNGSSNTYSGVSDLMGEIVAIAPYYNPAFDSWAYRVTRKSCAGVIEYVNLFGTTGVTGITGSSTVVEI